MKIYSATLNGVEPILVEIEIDLSPGLAFFQIVGLPDEVLKESKTRVKSAIIQGGFEFPYESRLVLNLAPSKLKKEGSGFELGLAVRILQSSGQIKIPDREILFLGELALDGTVKSVDDIEALALTCTRSENIKMIVMNKKSAETLSTHLSIPIFGIDHLQDLKNEDFWENRVISNEAELADLDKIVENDSHYFEKHFEDFIFTSFWAKHLKLATVGKLHYLLCGPPGCGKTFFAESLKVLRQKIYPLVDKNDSELQILNCLFKRDADEVPWSAPHHTSSSIGLIGGGKPPKPGAITRAHRGILFLDELLEFNPSTLDALREPIEKGSINVVRAGYHVRFPSNFQLIAATNPCRCGYWRHPFKGCSCSEPARQKYQLKLSGPLKERFDVKIFCTPGLGNEEKETGLGIIGSLKEINKFKSKGSTKWSLGTEDFLKQQAGSQSRSYRQIQKIKKLAPYLASLQLNPLIDLNHIKEASELQNFEF